MGGGPREINQDFYHRQQCSVLGCAVIYFDSQLKKTKTIYADYFSDVLSHDGVFVSQCISHLLTNIYKICPRLVPETVKTVNLWTDVGLHFRCQEVAHFFLVDVPTIFKTEVRWNTFAECHGKSIVDGHFGLLSRWVEQIETKKKVTSIDVLIELLNKKLIHSNFKKNKKNQLINKFFCYQQNGRPRTYKKLFIPNITNFYSFETNFSDNGEDISIGIKMLTDSDRYQENIYSKMKIKEVLETRQTKFGSKTTETSKHKKMCLDEVTYGANTSRRLKVQSQYL